MLIRRLLLVLLLYGVGSTRGLAQEAVSDTVQLLPEQLRQFVYFNMPRQEFVKRLPHAREISQRVSFRRVYIDQETDPPLDFMAFYFDKDNHEPLYEVILGFADTTTRNELAAQLLGPPNYNGDEWYVPRDSAFDYSAWRYQNKLIIIGRIEGTEWAEE